MQFHYICTLFSKSVETYLMNHFAYLQPQSIKFNQNFAQNSTKYSFHGKLHTYTPTHSHTDKKIDQRTLQIFGH